MPPQSKTRAAFTAITVSVASIALLQNLLLPALPLVQEDFGVPADATTWAITSWLIAAAVATPLIGRIGDLRGRRTAFLAVLTVVALGDIVAIVAPNLGILILGRVLQGAGGALFPLAFGLIRDIFPAHRITGAVGATSAIIGIGGAAGSVLAGPLSQFGGWRGVFSVPLIAAILGIVLTLAFVPRSTTRAQGKLNVTSAVLLSSWLIALLLPLSSGARWGWGSPVTIGLLVAAAVLLAAWVVVELRATDPLVDLRMLADRAIWPINVASLLMGVATFGYWGYLPQFLETPTSSGWGLGLSVQSAGLALLPLLVMMSSVGFFSGAITRVISLRTQLTLGIIAMAIGAAWTVLDHRALPQVFVSSGLFGLGVGLAMAATASLIVHSVPIDRVGVATGANANIRTVGSAIGSAMVAALVFGGAAHGSVVPESGYIEAWLTMAALLALAAIIIVVASPRTRRVAETEVPEPRLTADAPAA